jgi:hypothetical protein
MSVETSSGRRVRHQFLLPPPDRPELHPRRKVREAVRKLRRCGCRALEYTHDDDATLRRLGAHLVRHPRPRLG